MDQRPRGRKVGEAVTVRLPPDLEEVLRQRADAEDRPLAGIVRQAVRHYFAAELSKNTDKAEPAA
jgi:predicted transcriptional regulator